MQNARIVGYKSHPPKSRGITFSYCSSAFDLPKAIKSTMKYLLAILLLAFVAISMAVETSEAGKAKESQDAARDKRGFSSYYSPYAYAAPYAYNSYNLPYTYSPYSYSAYPYSAYPYYNHHHYNYPYYNHFPHYY